MQISSRYGEYALTGGFFWICQVALVVVLGSATHFATVVLKLGTEWIERIPPPAHGPLATAVGAFAIITVFVTGLVLDVIGSLLFLVEPPILRWYLARHETWVAAFCRRHARFVGSDHSLLMQELPEIKSLLFLVCLPFAGLAWSLESAPVSLRRRIHAVTAAEQLATYLTSFAVARSATAITPLADHIYLWRTARAVSVALLVLYVEVPFVSAIRNVGVAHFFELLAGAIIALVIGSCLTGAAYSRLCATLFGFTYLAFESEQGDAAAAPTA